MYGYWVTIMVLVEVLLIEKDMFHGRHRTIAKIGSILHIFVTQVVPVEHRKIVGMWLPVYDVFK